MIDTTLTRSHEYIHDEHISEYLFRDILKLFTYDINEYIITKRKVVASYDDAVFDTILTRILEYIHDEYISEYLFREILRQFTYDTDEYLITKRKAVGIYSDPFIHAYFVKYYPIVSVEYTGSVINRIPLQSMLTLIFTDIRYRKPYVKPAMIILSEWLHVYKYILENTINEYIPVFRYRTPPEYYTETVSYIIQLPVIITPEINIANYGIIREFGSDIKEYYSALIHEINVYDAIDIGIHADITRDIIHADDMYIGHLKLRPLYYSDNILDTFIILQRKKLDGSIIYPDMIILGRKRYNIDNFEHLVISKYPYLCHDILFRGSYVIPVESDLRKLLRSSVSGVLISSLTQYVKYPEDFILAKASRKINKLMGKRVISPEDIKRIVMDNLTDIILELKAKGYYDSEAPETHILILRDKLSNYIKKIIPQILNLIEERYNR